MKMRDVCTCRGFTLIEALVALLVLSIGLLGVAAMQLKALQGAHMGYQRSLASIIAIDAQERAWSYLAEIGMCPSSGQVQSGWGDNPQDWKDYWESASGLDFTESSGVSGSGCEYTVTLIWSEGRLAENEDVGTFIYDFKLPSG